jgi:hypothetical protein
MAETQRRSDDSIRDDVIAVCGVKRVANEPRRMATASGCG